MAKTAATPKDPQMLMVLSYAILFLVSSAVLWLANVLFPTQVALGTAALSPLWAIGLSMGVLSLITTFGIPFVTEYEKRSKTLFTPAHWMITYFFVNAAGLWVISRFSEQLGLGLRSWLVVVLLAAAMNLAQGMAMMQLGGNQQPKK